MVCSCIIVTTSFICGAMLIALKSVASDTADAVNIAALLILHKKIQSEGCYLAVKNDTLI